ncbi:hypothetical protein A3780_09565 [Kosakonia radicincitans]|uniref:lysozyme inhibitor LprI family protein n=1 Tax=Kosakonia radicincitans TaxID=283686 RepID=UPI0009033A56|nr:lysozyme inhibitor LprI family protein [Kosakonia radicincitans]APG17791.1 hypothetical protein A3780_09565 [Kosakonia radicincitans]VVT49513.1 hypothetical protein UYSO10_2859 [Kosakonia radicincitans]
MKKLLVLVSLLLASNASLAAAATDITSNKDVEACIQKFGENNSECLEDLSDKTDDALNKAYTDKLKEIEGFDYTQWWMGDEDRKKRMIDAFKKSQSEWLKYRDDYCNVATTGAQGTHSLGAAFAGCNINMNSRRMSEIQMIQMKNKE